MSAVDDHIAPWQSVYEGMKLINKEKTSSGHVAGVINPPISGKYHYKVNIDFNLNSNEWVKKSIEYDGSWWINWRK